MFPTVLLLDSKLCYDWHGWLWTAEVGLDIEPRRGGEVDFRTAIEDMHYTYNAKASLVLTI